MGTLIAIVVVGLVAWGWLDTARARDQARLVARRLCEEAGVQLLDQTVSLRRTVPRRTVSGFTLARAFVFEFSEDGASRREGRLFLVGQRLRRAVLEGERIGRVIVEPH